MSLCCVYYPSLAQTDKAVGSDKNFIDTSVCGQQ